MLQSVVNMRAAGRDRGRPVLLLFLLLLLLLVTQAQSVGEGEIVADLRELRREVEQVRNEVRRLEEPSKQSDKNAVLLSWLLETVKQLQSEMRALESELGDCRAQSGRAEEEINLLRGREEENRAALKHLGMIIEGKVRLDISPIIVVSFHISSLKEKLKQLANTSGGESPSLHHPHHLTKNSLRSWMAEMEASQQNIEDKVQQLQVRIVD